MNEPIELTTLVRQRPDLIASAMADLITDNHELRAELAQALEVAILEILYRC